jgi:hypothetical protein
MAGGKLVHYVEDLVERGSVIRRPDWGGPKNGNIVELGWLVSTDQSGDADPHIFVFHWKNWQGTCYNGCGWQQYSNTYYPGQNIGSLVGREIYIGYVFW